MDEWAKAGIPGFDELFDKGIPKGVSTLVAGGPGSGKTIFCLQTLNYAAQNGEKCLYMSFEESPERLKKHMHDFGWNPEELEEKGLLRIERYDPLEVSRIVEALLEKAKGELLIDATPVILPEGFKPDRIVVDSLSSIAASFAGREENYRVYAEQLFRHFEDLGVTSFLITETEADPKRLTRSGVEEFLADGVIVIYNLRKGDQRESAIEVLKMRGAKFQKKVVVMEIVDGKGMAVYPTQKVFGDF
jgi:circadian clock protein KaiC